MELSDILLKAVLPTALLSSLLSGLAVYYIYSRKLLPYTDKLAEKIGNEVEEGVTRSIQKNLPALEERVKSGMVSGVTEMAGNASQLTTDAIRANLEKFDPMGFMRDRRKDR